MIAKHMETRSPHEPPVRFYKTIALSFLGLTVILLAFVLFISVKKATINITAKEDVKQVSFNVALGSADNELKGSVATTSFEWSNTYYPTGVKMIEDKATGKVTIYNKQAVPQTLIKDTRLLNQDGVLFRIKNRVTIPANGSLETEAYSDLVGDKGDIGPSKFTVPGLSPELQSVVYAESKEDMKGGLKKSGVLSQEDLDAAMVSYKEQIRDAYVKSAGIDEKSVAFKVDVGQINADKKVGEEVTEFKLTANNTIVKIDFNKDDLIKLVDKRVGSEINRDSEKFLKTNNDPSVKLESYDNASGAASLSVTQEVLVTLDANADKLSVTNFTGKKKDEIERYVLGLDHVSGVEVKFSPSWMRTSPSVAEKIQVIVKSVK